MNKLTVSIGVGLIIVVAAAALFLLPPNKARAPTQPTQSNESEKHDLIRINEPQPGQRVSSPFSVNGEARGTWFFEASFPIELKDESGNTIGQGYAQAQGEWMTEDFVPFISIPIIFSPQPAGTKGLLLLHKDNPSGLPEHDDVFEVPVTF